MLVPVIRLQQHQQQEGRVASKQTRRGPPLQPLLLLTVWILAAHLTIKGARQVGSIRTINVGFRFF